MQRFGLHVLSGGPPNLKIGKQTEQGEGSENGGYKKKEVTRSRRFRMEKYLGESLFRMKLRQANRGEVERDQELRVVLGE